MSHDVLDRIASWDGNAVLTRFDEATGSWIFIALHDATLGPPTGGTRMQTYAHPADALHDAQRLAEGMTHKWAGLGMAFGGGKAVLATPGPLEGDARRGLLERYGDLLASLDGAFLTGEDLGTRPKDLAIVGGRCRFVLGYDAERREVTDPGPFTARGVFAGLRAAVAAATGSDDLSGRRVAIQGIGDVGGPLARMLAAHGATVVLADLDTDRAAALASELDGEAISADAVYDTPCDVYAPCAIGATVNAETVPRLRCRIIAGSANNQLREGADAGRVAERGILYVPDYILNAGGAQAFGLMQQGESDHDALFAQVDQLGRVVRDLLELAARERVSPVEAAQRQVARRLGRA